MCVQNVRSWKIENSFTRKNVNNFMEGLGRWYWKSHPTFKDLKVHWSLRFQLTEVKSCIKETIIPRIEELNNFLWNRICWDAFPVAYFLTSFRSRRFKLMNFFFLNRGVVKTMQLEQLWTIPVTSLGNCLMLRKSVAINPQISDTFYLDAVVN